MIWKRKLNEKTIKKSIEPVSGGGGQPQLGTKLNLVAHLTRLRHHFVFKQILFVHSVPCNDVGGYSHSERIEESNNIIKNKCGFTLAEILVTLTIIGIVAALTIPSLAANIKRKELQSEFKKVYSDLSTINEQFKLDYGMNMCTYTFDKIKTEGNGEWGNADLADQISGRMKTKFKNINSTYNWGALKTLNGNPSKYSILDDWGVQVDLLGRLWFMEYARPEAKCPIISVDLNGGKKPNKFGYDIFSFRPTKDGRVIPMGNNVYENDDLVGFDTITVISDKDKFCSFNSTDGHNGLGCGYWALIDEHPFEKGKDYWNDFLGGK